MILLISEYSLMDTIDSISLFFQIFASFASFTTVVMALFVYIRFRKRFFIHAALFFISFFIIALNTSIYHFYYLNGISPEQNPLDGFVLSGLIALSFSSGLGLLVMDILSVSKKSFLRLIPWSYAALCLSVFAVWDLFIPASNALFLENLFGIWVPACLAVIAAIIFRKRYDSGIFREEKKLIIGLALLNVCSFALSLIFPAFSLIIPFLAIICFCAIALSMACKYFFVNPHLKQGDSLPSDFVARFSITPREQEIICAVLAGKTNKELADMFFVSLKTIETHMGNIYRKTGVKNRLELFAFLRE